MIQHDILTGFIFLLGLLTLALSIYSCVKFNAFSSNLSSSASKLSHAIALQLAGEAILGFGTLLFATAEFFGWLSGWSYEFTSFLRFVMFFATAFTTMHLVGVIENLGKE